MYRISPPYANGSGRNSKCYSFSIDRKITAVLAPKHDEKDGMENKKEQSQQPQSAVKSKPPSNSVVVQPTNTEQGHKPSTVAEPQPRYPLPVSPPRFTSRHAGI